MSRDVVFRTIARLEFDEALAWYENQEPGLGLKFKSEVDLVFERIALHPDHFRYVRGEIRRAVLRRFPFTIHYLAESERIVVLAVFHAKRDPRHLEGRI